MEQLLIGQPVTILSTTRGSKIRAVLIYYKKLNKSFVAINAKRYTI